MAALEASLAARTDAGATAKPAPKRTAASRRKTTTSTTAKRANRPD